MKNYFYFLCTLILIHLVACSEDDNTGTTVQSIQIKNLAADPTTGYDTLTGAPIGDTKLFTFFRLSDSTVVNHSDSASSKWDLGFRSSRIIVNSGTSGPGHAGAFIYNGLFDDLKEVPADSSFKSDNSPVYAIGSSWSTYNGATMTINATPGKVLVIQTADGKYAKMEILSYYKNAPANPNAFKDEARYYTFRYVIQANGSKKFE